MVWTCHEARPRVCRKKDDGSGVTGKEEKSETKEKIFRCGKRRYEGSRCEEDVENDDTLWPPLNNGKGRKEKKKKRKIFSDSDYSSLKFNDLNFDARSSEKTTRTVSLNVELQRF